MESEHLPGFREYRAVGISPWRSPSLQSPHGRALDMTLNLDGKAHLALFVIVKILTSS